MSIILFVTSEYIGVNCMCECVHESEYTIVDYVLTMILQREHA